MSLRLAQYQVAQLPPSANGPIAPLTALDTLWFQLTGVQCNLACLHCYVPSGPNEDRVARLSFDAVVKHLDDAVALGVRDYYFTGGEPLMHPDFVRLCARVLAVGPLTVLTNGTLIDDALAAELRTLSDGTRYSFDLRVSLDGMDAATNDPVRGRGSFAQTIAGLRSLATAGMTPIVTVVEHAAAVGSPESRATFLRFLQELGFTRPRCKFLPLLRIGREPRRTRAYNDEELAVLHAPLDPSLIERLACTSSRLVSAAGVHVCPILLDGESAILGQTLATTLHPVALRWSACRTCLVDGLSCRT